ncbi:MAG: hypothetical protein LBD11_08410 [Candidatus Peribacteria bacterium]|jgi:hypothetical protein|nr:hypothetical protein [Candidatus Peribacteria bacterium]
MQINTSLTNTQQEQGRSIEKVLGFNTFVNKVKSQTEKTGIQPSDDDIFLLMDIYKGK